MVLETKILDLNVMTKNIFKKIPLTSQRCSTHPHQIHFELLSEQGLIGYLIFFFFIFSYFKKNF